MKTSKPQCICAFWFHFVLLWGVRHRLRYKSRYVKCKGIQKAEGNYLNYNLSSFLSALCS